MTKSKPQNHQDAIMIELKENRNANSINKGSTACTFEFLEDGLVKARLDFFLEGVAADNAPQLSEHSAVTAVADGLYINWKIFPSTAYNIAVMALDEDNIELLHSNNICIEAFCVDNNDDSKEWRFFGRVGEEVRHTVTDNPMHCNQPSSINYLL